MEHLLCPQTNCTFRVFLFKFGNLFSDYLVVIFMHAGLFGIDC